MQAQNTKQPFAEMMAAISCSYLKSQHMTDPSQGNALDLSGSACLN